MISLLLHIPLLSKQNGCQVYITDLKTVLQENNCKMYLCLFSVLLKREKKKHNFQFPFFGSSVYLLLLNH